MKILEKKATGGIRINPKMDTPVGLDNTISPRRINGLYLLMLSNFGIMRYGSIPFNICEPSKGNKGIRLKKAKKRFILIPSNRNSKIGRVRFDIVTENLCINCNMIPKRNAEIKFDRGPAKETNILSRLGFLKLSGLIGTGFPHPKCAKIKHIVPIKSRCAIGFMVSRPCILAVWSPNLSATKAWENSCTVMP